MDTILLIFITIALLWFALSQYSKSRKRTEDEARKTIEPDDGYRKRVAELEKRGSPTKALRAPPQAPSVPAAQPQKHRHPTRSELATDHAHPPPIPSSMRLKGKAYIIDGDTIVINKIKIRLAGIDAPELNQPWGQKSKWEMVRICKGNTIDVKLSGETSYDRLVGTCYLPDGRDIGAEIIKAGLALDGGHYSEGKYRHLEPDGVRRRLRYYGRWR